MLHVLILAGGRGKRFWPLSRKERPKQLLALGSGASPLEEAIERARSLTSEDGIHLCTTEKLGEVMDVHSLGIREENIILEPFRRDTAPALALASNLIYKADPEAVVVSLNSDHQIGSPDLFSASIGRAVERAEDGDIVVLGVAPTRPSTGYGYIRLGDRIGDGCFRCPGFEEKPSLDDAKRFLDSGIYLWNTGILTFRCDVFLDEMAKKMPDLSREMGDARSHLGTRRGEEAIRRAYERIDPVSIDYGLLEKTDRLVAVRGEFAWEDLGSWNSLSRIGEPDVNGNFVRGGGDKLVESSKNCIIFSEGPLVSTLGVQNLIIAATGDAVLVARRDRAQEVKRIVEELEKRNMDCYL